MDLLVSVPGIGIVANDTCRSVSVLVQARGTLCSGDNLQIIRFGGAVVQLTEDNLLTDQPPLGLPLLGFLQLVVEPGFLSLSHETASFSVGDVVHCHRCCKV